jgi:D-lactate dehydrogenase (cytochrome)
LKGALQAIVGADHVNTDQAARAYYSEDLFFQGPAAAAVIAPGSREKLASCVAVITSHGFAVVPRGGGLSYTGGYVPQSENSILIDTRRLDEIVEINQDDLYVTAECGCTFAALHAALTPLGLRIESFGPASGRVSTVGGSLSQNSLFFGGSKKGSVADVLLSLEVVLASGEVINTGTGAIDGGTPFSRYFGPDMSGLFVGDGGAFGVKLTATFRLEHIPAGIAFGSFTFSEYESMIAAETEILRLGVASEILGLGPWSPKGGTPSAPPTLHAVTEGLDQAAADSKMAALRAIATRDGEEIEATIPAFIRANPFGFMQSLLDEEGRLQSWTHGIVPYSRAVETYRKVCGVLEAAAVQIEKLGIKASISALAVRNGFFVEPVLAWYDTPREIHLRGLGGDAPASRGDKANPEATKLIEKLREQFRDLYHELKATHFQIGKFYNHHDALDAGSSAFLSAIKKTLDPKGLMNPGALGL